MNGHAQSHYFSVTGSLLLRVAPQQSPFPLRFPLAKLQIYSRPQFLCHEIVLTFLYKIEAARRSLSREQTDYQHEHNQIHRIRRNRGLARIVMRVCIKI